MADNVDEKYILQLVTDTSESLDDMAKWREEVDLAKKRLLEFRNTTEMSLDDVVKIIKDRLNEAKNDVGGFSDTFKNAGKAVNQAAKEIRMVDRDMDRATKEIERGEGATKSFEGIIETAFGFSLGTLAVNALQKVTNRIKEFIRFVKEGIQEAGEFSMDIARLNVNLRAFQRTGGDLEGRDLLEFIDELGDRYRIFSEQEIVAGTQEFLNFARQLDLTGQQVKDFLDLIVQQAIVMGTDIPTASRQMTTAITTGRTQSLRPLGIALSGTTIQTLALKRGLVETGDAMTNQARAAIIYEEAMKQVDERNGEVDKVLDTLGGTQQENIAGWQDLKKAVGELFAPEASRVNKIISRTLELLEKLTNKLKIVNARILAGLEVQRLALANIDEILKQAFTGDITFDIFDEYEKAFEELRGELFLEETVEDVKNANREIIESTEEMADKLKDEYRDLGIRIREELIDRNEDLLEADEDFQEKLDEMRADFNEDKKVEEIKLGDDIAKINRRFQDKVAELNEDFREEDKQAEEEYFDDLRKLRENFLLDLEDALQQRNAKQIVSLIKQFNLRQRQLQREQQMEERQRERTRQDRLEALRRDRDIRIREARIEFQERRRLMRREYEFERQQERIRHEQRKADIREETELRIEELIRRFEDEQKITEEGAKLVKNTLEQYFGEGGEIDRIYDFLVQNTQTTLRNVTDAIQKFSKNLKKSFESLTGPGGAYYSSPLPPLTGPGGSYYSGPGFAEGGSVIANEPTTVTFGEGGPEKATFEPIGKVGQNEDQTFMTGDVSSATKNGKLAVELFLSPDLEARIVDQSMSEVADVMIKERRR